jgi:flagellar secretion chaperone FliS
MAYSNYGKYLETEVFSADPVQLVCMLYRAAIDSTAAARRHLKAGEIRERSKNIMRAHEIVLELTRSLDPQYEVSKNLASLYNYIREQLLLANSKQIDAPLAEVEKLLSTLYDGWKEARAAAAAAGPSPESYQPVSCTY